MEDSPPRKRARSEGTHGCVAIGRHTPDSIHAFFTQLSATTFDMKTLANPANCISVTFPSLLRTSIEMQGPVYTHMGVPIVQEILQQMETLRVSSTLALLATVGAGKSHILALVAGVLFSRGHRVVFIPDGPMIADDKIFWLKLAFALAFADDQQMFHRLSKFTKLEDFVMLARESRDDVYFLVDGFDQLDDEMKQFVKAASGTQILVYTAYALDTGFRRNSWIRIPSGFSQNEYNHWLTHYQDRIPSPVVEPYYSFIEYTSGAVPRLLQPLCRYAGSRLVDAVTMYRNCAFFEDLNDEVDEFVMKSEQWSESQRTRFYQIMNACVTETLPEVRPGANTALWDPKYFYFDNEGRGHTHCGIARDAVIDFLRSVDLSLPTSLFTTDAWYACARSPKIRMRCQAITQICLTRIATGGLSQADATGGAMRIHIFRQTLSFGWMFEQALKTPQGTSSFFCIPGLEVCRFLAGVIVRINPRDKMVHLIPLQITTNSVCSDLATPFFAVVWHKWETAIREEGFNVMHTFVCVDSLLENSKEVMRATAEHREKVKFISPPYTMRSLSAAQLDPKLGRILRPERSLPQDLTKRLP
ncbi:Glycoside hydrolase [Mycena indigotica]|uniref:Glycoside hydrolase n=1 Tax=Mycena indigotica TaxID=2126181 RepID=A0A8H6S9R9_9AGAR|nr:Glycoside hydrolase [Mycena indigotica]KAF7295459.1 Glycoside hydrolase [Mycena indigotica]